MVCNFFFFFFFKYRQMNENKLRKRKKKRKKKKIWTNGIQLGNKDVKYYILPVILFIYWVKGREK